LGDTLAQSSRRIEAVIFDLDDTLIDWAAPAVTWKEFTAPKTERVRRYLIEQGHRPPEAETFFESIEQAIQELWAQAKQSWQIASMGDMLLEVFGRMGLDVSRMDIGQALAVYDWGPLPGVEPFDDAIPVLQTLRQREYKLGLVTNSFLPMWMRDAELEAYRLIDYLDVRVTSGDIGYIKPHPQIYRHVLEKLETAAHQAVFVGDRPANDIAGANEVGLISVLISPPHLDRDLDGIVPDFTIGALSDLLPILDTIEQATPA